MSLADALLPEFEQEMKVTRRVLERVPDEKGEWRPHPRSFPMGHLAQLVARMPGWIANAVKETELNMVGFPGYSFETTETLLAEFDGNVREAVEALASTSDEEMEKLWTLRAGEQVFFSAPRREIVRQNINHLVHHRGQLTVYLRLQDVPVPSIYGPSADEGWAPPG